MLLLVNINCAVTVQLWSCDKRSRRFYFAIIVRKWIKLYGARRTSLMTGKYAFSLILCSEPIPVGLLQMCFCHRWWCNRRRRNKGFNWDLRCESSPGDRRRELQLKLILTILLTKFSDWISWVNIAVVLGLILTVECFVSPDEFEKAAEST